MLDNLSLVLFLTLGAMFAILADSGLCVKFKGHFVMTALNGCLDK
jgi:hypothetical protein